MKQVQRIWNGSIACVGYICMGAYAVSASEGMQGAVMEKGITFLELLRAGGWVMAIIGVLSVGVVALCIVGALSLKQSRYVPEGIKKIMTDYIQGGQYKKAYSVCREGDTSLGMIMAPALKRLQHLEGDVAHKKKQMLSSLESVFMMEHIKKAVEAAGMREADKIRGLVVWFSHVGVITPMLGLLGTVLGMIRAFGAIAYKVETGKPVLLSSAISQAMVTTAGGLIVGIAAMMAYYYFTARSNAIIGNMEEQADEMVDSIEQQLREKHVNDKEA